MAFCLIPEVADRFLEAIKTGKINPAKLTNMTSDERHTLFSDLVGEQDAKHVNALLESKLLLKNQQQGLITWAKQVSGIKPEVKRDLLSRIEKMDKVLTPETEKDFLKDLASTRLGVDVTAEEANKIASLSKQIVASREALTTGGDRLAYGKAKVELANYVNSLKEEAGKVSLRDLPEETIKHPAGAVGKVAGLSKSIKASLDDSAIFRQGWKTLFTHPGSWQKNARQTFVDAVREFGKKPVMDELMADITSRPNYDRMVKAKLAIGNIEEAFPTHLPEKVPVLGRAYKASQTAYEGFIFRQRADIFDKYIDIAKKSGINVDNKEQLQSIGKLVNSLTGRGNLGKLEPIANTVNNVFFSPRFLKSHLDVLTAHAFDPKVSPFAKKQAAINLAKVISGTASILGVAHAINPKSVELDPRSSDFGKIRVGNTRFDVTGGMSSIATLSARLLSQSTKSATTGVVKKLNSGYGSPTGMDVATDFFANKLSPAASVVKDLIKQEDFNGNKPTVPGELKNLFVPLPITTFKELRDDPRSANVLLGILADGLGISTNTYGKSTTKWDPNTSKEMSQLRQKIGEAQFKQANNTYNKQYDEWLSKNRNTAVYKSLSDDKKQKAITYEKDLLKTALFKQYNFKPTSDK